MTPDNVGSRNPEVAACFDDGQIHLVLRQDDAKLSFASIDASNLKISAWTPIPLSLTPEGSSEDRQTGAGLILEDTLRLVSLNSSLVVSFTDRSPILIMRDGAKKWSKMSILARAGAGRADGNAVSVSLVGNNWFVAWIDAKHQAKSLTFGIPWSDTNPYLGNNDIYYTRIPEPLSAEEFSTSLGKSPRTRVTSPLGFAQSLKLIANANASTIELFWLGTDRVTRSTQGTSDLSRIFHTTLNPDP